MKTSPARRHGPLLCSALLLTLSAGSARAQIRLDVNDRPVELGNAGAARLGGRVFIPLRAVAEALGADVRWDADTQTVHGSKGARDFALPIGSRTAWVNGRSLALDAPARILSGNTMVPLRFVAEALGAEVDWNASEQRVAINLPGRRTAGGYRGGSDRAAGDGGGAERRRLRRNDGDAEGTSVSGELISVQSSAHPPTVTVRVEGTRQTYRVGDGARVLLRQEGARGRMVSMNELRAGDRVNIRLDAAGRMAERIDATSGAGRQDAATVRGEVIRVLPAGNPPLIVVSVAGTRKTYDAGGATVTTGSGLDGRGEPASLRDLAPGDQGVIHLDGTGQVAERIEAVTSR